MAAAGRGAPTATGSSAAAATLAAAGAEQGQVQRIGLQVGVDPGPRAGRVVVDLAGQPARPGLEGEIGEARLPRRALGLGRQLEGACWPAGCPATGNRAHELAQIGMVGREVEREARWVLTGSDIPLDGSSATEAG